MSRPIIYHNIEESKFIVKDGNLEFYFSSLFNKERYLKKIDENLVKNVLLFSQLYNLESSTTLENVIKLKIYKTIEKRGFYVKNKGKRLKLLYSIEDL